MLIFKIIDIIIKKFLIYVQLVAPVTHWADKSWKYEFSVTRNNNDATTSLSCVPSIIISSALQVWCEVSVTPDLSTWASIF